MLVTRLLVPDVKNMSAPQAPVQLVRLAGCKLLGQLKTIALLAMVATSLLAPAAEHMLALPDLAQVVRHARRKQV